MNATHRSVPRKTVKPGRLQLWFRHEWLLMMVGREKTGRAVVRGRIIGALLTTAGALVLFMNAISGIPSSSRSASEGASPALTAINTAFLAFAVALVRTAYAVFPSEIDRLRRGFIIAAPTFVAVVVGLWLAWDKLSPAGPLSLYEWVLEAIEWVVASPLALTGFLLTLAGMVAPDFFLHGNPKKKKEHEELKRRRSARARARKRLRAMARPSIPVSPNGIAPGSKPAVNLQSAGTPKGLSVADSLMTVAGLGFLLIGIWALQKLPEPSGRHEV